MTFGPALEKIGAEGCLTSSLPLFRSGGGAELPEGGHVDRLRDLLSTTYVEFTVIEATILCWRDQLEDVARVPSIEQASSGLSSLR